MTLIFSITFLQRNGKIRKYLSSTVLLQQIKKMNIYEVTEKKKKVS